MDEVAYLQAMLYKLHELGLCCNDVQHVEIHERNEDALLCEENLSAWFDATGRTKGM